MENKIEESAKTIASAMSATMSDIVIQCALREALQRAKDESEEQKLKLTIKAIVSVKPDDTIEYETWSEKSQSKTEKSEKIGETIDLLQQSFKM